MRTVDLVSLFAFALVRDAGLSVGESHYSAPVQLNSGSKIISPAPDHGKWGHSLTIHNDGLPTSAVAKYERRRRSENQTAESIVPSGLHLLRSSGNLDVVRLSHDISAILESLLKDYNNNLRPGFEEGKLTTVRLNMLVRSIGPISEKEMKYSMDCYLRQEWQDDRLKFQGPLQELTLNINMLELLWKPDTYFHNGHGSYVHTITRPNKLFRIDQNGKILYSVRLTIKAKCPMELRNFPMDKQSCPLIISSYAYTTDDVIYEWDSKYVSLEPGMTLSQYDLLNKEYQNYSVKWRKGGGVYSILQVNFNLQRHKGYFLIQVYVPCILIVILSWVSFWINREATSDRVGLGITTVLTLSTISLDTRTDLPKVHYATALDWFILLSFGYCIATLLQFAAVHYFTKIGSGEVPIDEDEWQDLEVLESYDFTDVGMPPSTGSLASCLDVQYSSENKFHPQDSFRNRTDFVVLNTCRLHYDITSVGSNMNPNPSTSRSLDHLQQERVLQESVCQKYGVTQSLPSIASHLTFRTTETQTDRHDSFWSQLSHCVTGNDRYRRERQRQALKEGSVNSVSVIDKIARVLFPASYGLLNLWYWYSYYHTEIEYSWKEPGLDYNYLN